MTRLTRCIGWTALVVVAMVAVVVVGCGGSSEPVVPTQTGSITGTVKHAGTGLPLGGIAVTAGGVATNTNADGSFKLNGVRPGNQEVVVTPSAARDLILPPPNNPIMATVVAGQTTTLPGTILLMDGPDAPPEPPQPPSA